MIPRHSVKIHRDGQDPFYPTIGQPFDFTPAEIKMIRAHNHDALRDPKFNTARTDTEAGDGEDMPEPNDTRDANVLSRAQSNTPPPGRNQGGSLQEGQIARGNLGDTPNTTVGAKPTKPLPAPKTSATTPPPADDDDL
jgi:hypothetical protein